MTVSNHSLKSGLGKLVAVLSIVAPPAIGQEKVASGDWCGTIDSQMEVGNGVNFLNRDTARIEMSLRFDGRKELSGPFFGRLTSEAPINRTQDGKDLCPWATDQSARLSGRVTGTYSPGQGLLSLALAEYRFTNGRRTHRCRMKNLTRDFTQPILGGGPDGIYFMNDHVLRDLRKTGNAFEKKYELPNTVVTVSLRPCCDARTAVTQVVPVKGRPRKGPVTQIVLHAIGGPDCDEKRAFNGLKRVEDAVREFETAPESKSIHFIIGRKGEVVRMVSESEVAFHVSKKACETCNDTSIGIEIMNDGDGKDEFKPEQMEALNNLLRRLMACHAVPVSAIKGHSDLDTRTMTCDDGRRFPRKVDPGSNFKWDELRRSLTSNNPR